MKYEVQKKTHWLNVVLFYILIIAGILCTFLPGWIPELEEQSSAFIAVSTIWYAAAFFIWIQFRAPFAFYETREKNIILRGSGFNNQVEINYSEIKNALNINDEESFKILWDEISHFFIKQSEMSLSKIKEAKKGYNEFMRYCTDQSISSLVSGEDKNDTLFEKNLVLLMLSNRSYLLSPKKPHEIVIDINQRIK